MAYLYCRACNGDGIVSVVYCRHELKILGRSIRCCSLCNKRDPIDEFLDSVVVVGESEVERLLTKGYQFSHEVMTTWAT